MNHLPRLHSQEELIRRRNNKNSTLFKRRAALLGLMAVTGLAAINSGGGRPLANDIFHDAGQAANATKNVGLAVVKTPVRMAGKLPDFIDEATNPTIHEPTQYEIEQSVAAQKAHNSAVAQAALDAAGNEPR
jgi:hypothetical protein